MPDNDLPMMLQQLKAHCEKEFDAINKRLVELEIAERDFGRELDELKNKLTGAKC